MGNMQDLCITPFHHDEGCAGLGGRKCLVVKSLKNLSNNHTFQYIHMVNAPAGG